LYWPTAAGGLHPPAPLTGAVGCLERLRYQTRRLRRVGWAQKINLPIYGPSPAWLERLKRMPVNGHEKTYCGWLLPRRKTPGHVSQAIVQADSLLLRAPSAGRMGSLFATACLRERIATRASGLFPYPEWGSIAKPGVSPCEYTSRGATPGASNKSMGYHEVVTSRPQCRPRLDVIPSG